MTDVSSVLHGLLPKVRDVSSKTPSEKLYFSKNKGCLTRNAHSINPPGHGTGAMRDCPPPRAPPPHYIYYSIGDVHRVTLRVYTRFPSSAEAFSASKRVDHEPSSPQSPVPGEGFTSTLLHPSPLCRSVVHGLKSPKPFKTL